MIDRKEHITDLPFWVISDTHFSHNPIIEYADRPEDHEQIMIDNWRAIVQPEDYILHLGDFAFGKSNDIPGIFQELPGKKILVKGNHDKRRRKWYRRCGFSIVDPFISEFGGYTVLFTHYPQPRYVKQHPKALNVHGHTHENVQRDRRLINVCVEQTDYKPVWIEDVLRTRIAELESVTVAS